MILRDIEILNFKNIADTRLEFSAGVNCLLGRNGMGKSNLLEAIHFLCLARGMSSMPESAYIRHGEELLSIRGNFSMETGAEEQISCGIVRGKGKTLKRNGKSYERISQHIGNFPAVCVIPRDSELVSGSGEERRKLMDMVISQADPAYLSQLIRYNRSLESRNRMLRAGVRDNLLYESVEQQMAEAATVIHQLRQKWVEEIAPELTRYYSQIATTGETATLSYRSILNESDMTDIFARTRGKDVALGYTSQGVHRDDLGTGLDGRSMRRLGSQGQIKTFTFALRLAIYDYLRQQGGVTPLLLLDDIFDKLDAGRVRCIMDLVSRDENRGFGQIFITDTNREHLDDILHSIGGEKKLIEVNDGVFTELSS